MGLVGVECVDGPRLVPVLAGRDADADDADVALPVAIPVAAFPLPGVATIPRHVAARRVHAVVRADVAALFAMLNSAIVESIPETVPEEARQASTWHPTA